MEGSLIIWDLLCNFLLYTSCIFYVKAVGDRKVLTEKADYVLLIIVSIIEACIMQKEEVGWEAGISALLVMILVFRPFGKKFYKKWYLLLDFFGYVIWGFFVLMTAYCCFVDFQCLNSFENQNYYELSFTMINILFLLGIYLLVFRKKTEISFTGGDRVFIGLVLFLLFAVMTLLNDNAAVNAKSSQAEWYVRLCNIGLLAGEVLIPVMVIYARMSAILQKKQHYNEQYIALELEHFQREYERQKEIRRFRHDIRNHLLNMSHLLEEEKIPEAKEYCKELLGEIPTKSQVIITGDDILDGILAYKYDQMKKCSIRFEHTGVFEKSIPMKPIDICTVFANALDNALEACMKIPETQKRWITLQVKRSNYFSLVEITNSTEESLAGKQMKSTEKQDKENHGFGLQNIKKVMELYGGSMELNQEPGMFRIRLIIKCE